MQKMYTSGGGWVGVSSKNEAISAFNKDVVEVEAQLDKMQCEV